MGVRNKTFATELKNRKLAKITCNYLYCCSRPGLMELKYLGGGVEGAG